MKNLKPKLLLGLGLILAISAPAAGHWSFDDNLTVKDPPALTGKVGVFEKGKPPVFDSDIPATNIWNGANGLLANGDNRKSLRFANEGVVGSGTPMGGEVLVSGADVALKTTDLTIEVFVRMGRQMPRHSLLASKRRNGQTGASWSLSIDPQGLVRARFDVQPEANASNAEGFNQSFASAGSVADGSWHHVALTFDHATRSAVIYVDYVRCGGGITKGPLVYDDGPLIFGRGLDGWLDEVQLTATVLHPEQFLRSTRFFSDMKPRLSTVAMLDQTPTRVQTGLKVEWPKIGTLKPKSVKELETPMWSLGCETLDRDLADWDAYKTYLEPLGIKHIRLQGGWARTEKAKGVYDFTWLDHIVDDALARGLEVCLETSYGNRLYQKDAAMGPGGRLPEGDETLAAWDRWVEAMARRYSAKGVREWMMFNEPNLTKSNTVEKITAFNIRTAEAIKRIDPAAKIGGLVSCNLDIKLIRGFLQRLKDQGKTGLFNSLIYHGYGANPDTCYPGVTNLLAVLRELAPELHPWQGEAGCASEEVQYALSGMDWTELSHAKWNARRMLGDFGRGVRSSVFSITDISYHKSFISRYGLLKTESDNSIIKVKTAYYVVQNIVSVFNDSVQRAPDYELEVDCEKRLSWHAFKDKKTGLDLVTLWDGTAVPDNYFTTVKAKLTVKNGCFKEPVWVDLMTGNIHAIPASQVVVNGTTHTFGDIPVYDGPVVIMDKSLLSFVQARQKK